MKTLQAVLLVAALILISLIYLLVGDMEGGGAGGLAGFAERNARPLMWACVLLSFGIVGDYIRRAAFDTPDCPRGNWALFTVSVSYVTLTFSSGVHGLVVMTNAGVFVRLFEANAGMVLMMFPVISFGLAVSYALQVDFGGMK